MNAWPAFRQVLLDGWLLRFAGGYSKRINSVQPQHASRRDLAHRVEACERLCAEAGRPAIFRLTSLEEHDALEELLAERGYLARDHTLVLHRPVTVTDDEAAEDVALERMALDPWLEQFSNFSVASDEDRTIHRRILDAVPAGRTLFALATDGARMACGMGVREGEFFGLFDLVTDPAARRRGHGTALVRGMLAAAVREGAHHAYLQVTEANAPARHVYHKLGFRKAYAYRYWMRKR